MRTLPRHPSSAGFSIIEVMCAVAILGFGLVGLIQGLSTTLQSARDAERHTAAAWYAAGLIEFARADGYLRAGVTDGPCGDALPNHRWQQTVQSGQLDGLFEVTITIRPEPSGPAVFEMQTRLFEAPTGDTLSTPDRRRREGPP